MSIGYVYQRAEFSIQDNDTSHLLPIVQKQIQE